MDPIIYPSACPNPAAADSMEKGQICHVEGSPDQLQVLADPNLPFRASARSVCSISRIWLSKLLRLTRRQRAAEDPDSEPIQRTIDECPRGFPRFAAFQDSDENFMIYRKFGFLRSRLLLYKQDELGALEKQLVKMDQNDSVHRPKCLMARDLDDAREPQLRKQLLECIELKLYSYDRLVMKTRQFLEINRPSTRDYNSVKSYLWTKKPFFKDGLQFIRRKEDFITLRKGRDNAWFDGFFEDILKLIPCRAVDYLFCSKEKRAKSTDPDLKFYSKERIDRFIGVVHGMLILFLLLLPVYMLYQLAQKGDMTSVSVGVMLVFTLVFALVLSLFTRAKRHEILAASAGYCAVMVVFIGNLKGP